jgi:hypothetical protein
MILLAYSAAGVRGPQAPKKSLSVRLFASKAGKKAHGKRKYLEGFALQTSLQQFASSIIDNVLVC